MSETKQINDGLSMIAEERRSQIDAHDYTDDHDDRHVDGAITEAAYAYLTAVLYPDEALHAWPWDDTTFRPSEDQIKNLVKAGALIAAEIDRQLRAKGGAA